MGLQALASMNLFENHRQQVTVAEAIQIGEVAIAQKLLTDKLLNKTVSWQSTAAIIYSIKPFVITNEIIC